jgi:hypothetical protein
MLRPLRGRLVLLPALLLPLAGAIQWPSPSKSTPKTRPTLKGVIRYERRGVSAIPSPAIVGAVFVGGSAALGSQRAVKGFFKAMSAASALTGKSSMKDVNDFLRSTDNFDMSGLPVKAEYSADVSFTLEEGKDGVFELKEGMVTWSIKNNTRIELRGDGGNTHIFHDQASGQGSSPLTPDRSSITLRTEGKGKDIRFALDIDIKHPMPIDGSALWSAMSGLNVLKITEHAGTEQWHMNVLGQQHDDPPTHRSPDDGGFGYWRTGPLDSVARGREVWLNMFDSPERIEYELFLDCTAEIERPVENDELVFDQKRPGKIEQYAKSKVTPGIWGSAVKWIFPEIKDSKVDPPPEGATGDSVAYTYTGLPAKNSDLGFADFATDFESRQAGSAGCKGDKRPAGFYFSRETNNNPGKPAAPRGSSRTDPDPNWFYYWLQTGAAQGHRENMKYSPGNESLGHGVRCSAGGDYGVYTLESDFITICDLAKVGFMSFSHPGLGPVRKFHGIDAFGVTVKHEWQHYMNYKRWWGDRYGRYIDAFDRDQDHLPDDREDSIPPPPPLNQRVAHFNPLIFDSALDGLGDEHTIAWAAELQYQTGLADAEDWSCEGGHQAFSDKCKEVFTVIWAPPAKETGPHLDKPKNEAP